MDGKQSLHKMKLKIFYFNDTMEIQSICLGTLHIIVKYLNPAQGDYFDLELKEGQVPYVKVWKNMVLIGGITEKL
jgi:hypothetical protein